MASRKPSLPRPPTPWTKKRKVSSQLQQPVVAKSAKAPTQKPISSIKEWSIKENISDSEIDVENLESPFEETANPILQRYEQYKKEVQEESTSPTEDTEEPLSPPIPTVTLSRPKAPTTRVPVVVMGRRPDYKHYLVGLNIGDQIVFHKNPSLVASIVDLDNKVEFNGTEYEGIIPAAEEAYLISGLTPPKRITGLSEWRDPRGVRLRVLYEKINPFAQLPLRPATSGSTTTPSQQKVVNE